MKICHWDQNRELQSVEYSEVKNWALITEFITRSWKLHCRR